MRRSLAGLLQAVVFSQQLLGAFGVRHIFGYAINRADGHALRLVKMPYAFGAQVGVDLVKILAHADGLIGALRLANIAIDAVIGDFQRHGFTPLPLAAWLAAPPAHGG